MAGNRHPVRPVAARRAGTQAVSPPARPPTARPLAYVGFGTVPLFSDAPGLVRAVVGALVAHGFDVFVTTGDELLATEFAATHPGRVTVRRWVELAPLLASCSLAVCHGGAGTVLAALAAGVPLLLVPRGAPSQERMGAACVARGVGRVVAWDGGNVDDVDAAVDDMARRDGFRAAARSLGREIASMPAPSTAGPLLAGLVSAG